jgi:hypothetical protein
MPYPIPDAMRWPLRSLGLDAGRSLSNASPSAELQRSRREEQHAYILEGIALARSVPRTAAGLTDRRELRHRAELERRASHHVPVHHTG